MGTIPDPAAGPVPAHRRRSREARLAEILSDMGFASDSVPDPSGLLVRLRHCPFREVAMEHQAVVCSLHLGLMQGALAGMAAPLATDRLEPFVEPGLCLAHLSVGPPSS